MKKIFLALLICCTILYGCSRAVEPVVITLLDSSGVIFQDEQTFPLKQPRPGGSRVADVVELPLPTGQRWSWENVSLTLPDWLNSEEQIGTDGFDLVLPRPSDGQFVFRVMGWHSAGSSLEAELTILDEEVAALAYEVTLVGLNGYAIDHEYENEVGQIVLLQSADTYILFFGGDERDAWVTSTQMQFQALIDSLVIEVMQSTKTSPATIEPTPIPTDEPVIIVPTATPQKSAIEQPLQTIYTDLFHQTQTLESVAAQATALQTAITDSVNPTWEIAEELYAAQETVHNTIVALEEQLWSAEESIMSLYALAHDDAEIAQIDAAYQQLGTMQSSAATIHETIDALYDAIVELESCICED